MVEPFIYEQPLDESVRLFLRIESLCQQIDYHLDLSTAHSTQVAMGKLLELYTVTHRIDLKREVITALSSQISRLQPLTRNPNVDTQKLEQVLDEQAVHLDHLHGLHNQLGQHLKENSFINNLHQRMVIPAGASSFDLPAFHAWLQDTKSANRDIEHWLKPYTPATEAIRLMLKLIRQSGQFLSVTAETGFMTQSLEMGKKHQLIRVRLPENEAKIFPEISAGKHRFTVRFFNLSSDKTAPKLNRDITFSLALCAL